MDGVVRMSVIHSLRSSYITLKSDLIVEPKKYGVEDLAITHESLVHHRAHTAPAVVPHSPVNHIRITQRVLMYIKLNDI